MAILASPCCRRQPERRRNGVSPPMLTVAWRRLVAQPVGRVLDLVRAQWYWLRSFSILLALFLFGDLSAAAGRGLLPVYAEDILGREPDFSSLLVSAPLVPTH